MSSRYYTFSDFLPPPPSKRNLDEYASKIVLRFHGDYELASSFVEKSLGHQVDKSNGLIAFNALLAATVAAQPKWFLCYGSFSFFLLGTSSLLMMSILISLWGKSDIYSSAANDLAHSIKIVVLRSWALNIAVCLSTIALIIVFGLGCVGISTVR
jgi:hypothetical protein